jgi:uncharacterized protein (DUF488 family)
LFLLCNEYLENNIYYEFVPQNYGPISLQAEKDKKALIKKNLFENQPNYKPVAIGYRCAVDLDFFEKLAVQKLKNDWGAKNFEDLQNYLQGKYPNYFNLNGTKNNEPAFFTIGYEGVSLDEYLQKLLKNNVRLLCDVRKNAYSQKFGFSKNELQNALKKVGLEYIHIPELGVKSEMRESLETAQDYKTLFDFYESEVLPNQPEKLNLLVDLMHQHKRIAITCFEAKHHECHRSRIAKNLQKNKGLEIEHI